MGTYTLNSRKMQRETPVSSPRYPRVFWENVLFAFFLVVNVIPIWSFHHFPSQDGPGHVYNAYLLSGWWKSSFPIDRGFFVFNPAPVPNWLTTAVLALLMQITNPHRAEKILLTLYVISLPLAMRYAARSFCRDTHYLYFFSFAFIYNHFFHLGMVNFCLSLAWYLIFIGYWARHRQRLGLSQTFVLIGLTFLFYFSNGLSYYIGIATVALLSLLSLFSDYRRGNANGWLARLVRPQIGVLLVIPLSVSYLALHGRYYNSSQPSRVTWEDVIWSVSRLPMLTSANDHVDLNISRAFAVLLMVTFLLSCYYRRKLLNLVWTDALLIASGIQFILYLLAPGVAAGVGLINARMFLFPLLTFVLWLAIQPFGKIPALLLTAAAIFASLALLAKDVDRYVWQTPILNEFYATASRVERNSTILSLNFGRCGYDPSGRDRGLKYDPFLHATGLIAVERGLVDLNDYEAATRNFPLVYKGALDPSDIIGNGKDYGGSPHANIVNYYRNTGRFVDYVLLWNVQEENSTDAAAKSMFDELAADYVLMYSAPHIPLQLYRLRREIKGSRKTL